MGIAQGHFKVGALEGGTVADADQLERLDVPLGDTDDHVVDERTGQAVQRTVLALVIRALDDDFARFVLADLHVLVERTGQLAFGALDGDVRAVDGNLDSSGNRNGQLTNTRH